MKHLEETLRLHNIDTSSFGLLIDRGQEKIYSLAINGTTAIAEWQRLRDLVDQTGFWPVLLGGGEELKILESYQFKKSILVNDTIQQGLKIDGAFWLKERFEGMHDDEEDWESVHGEWPNDFAPGNTFIITYGRFSQQPLEKIYLALVPTQHSWQVPVFLGFGDWNYCPNPEEHASVMKYWQELYGAEIVAMTHDTIELAVAQPPSDRVQALKLAEEQYAYSPDIVEQGVTTIEALAATLLNGKVWYFWWD